MTTVSASDFTLHRLTGSEASASGIYGESRS
jgi:hypothetical protein